MNDRLAGVSHVIAVHSAKGGVGKSTVSVNLAVGLAQQGLRVGLMDADVHGPSGSILLGNGEWPSPGNDPNTIQPITAHGIKFISMGNMVTRETPLIWRGAMVHGVLTQFFDNVNWGVLDVLLIDMPPGTGDAQLSISQAVSLDGVVVVTTPQELALVDTVRGIRAFERMKVPMLGMIENMSVFVCDECGEKASLFGDSGAAQLAEEMGFPLLGRMPLDPMVCQGGDEGLPFMVAHPNSVATRAMLSVVAQVREKLDATGPGGAIGLEWRKMDWVERVDKPTAEDLIPEGPVSAMWQVSNDELGITWRDGETTTLSVRDLRLACPCAVCIDEWSGKALLDPETVPHEISLKSIQSVGRYAIQPTFSDDHQSGLYQFDRLREVSQQRKSS